MGKSTARKSLNRREPNRCEDNNKEEILHALAMYHQENEKHFEMIGRRLDKVEEEITNLSERYTELDKRPAIQALENLQKIKNTIMGVIVTILTTSLLGLVVKVLWDAASRSSL